MSDDPRTNAAMWMVCWSCGQSAPVFDPIYEVCDRCVIELRGATATRVNDERS